MTDNVQLSQYQKDILDAAKHTDRNLIINATAGSGKSFTLKQIANSVKNKRILYATFDKRSVEDIKFSLPDYVDASTWHSFGFAQIRRHSPGVRVNTGKNLEIFKELKPKESWGLQQVISENYSEIMELVSRMKNLMGENPYEVLGSILFTERESECIAFAKKIFTESLARADKEIDFDDMIYLPASKLVPTKREYDLVLCDESQDLNPAQIELVKMAGNRAIIVGDRNQAIYLFRGADSSSMSKLQEHFEALPLPLSITYRNPHSHVRHINQRFPEIAHEGHSPNPEGMIGDIKLDYFLDTVKPGDLALCRLNAPLVPMALHLIAEGKTAYIAGRNIGKGLVKFFKDAVKKSNGASLIDATIEHATKSIWKLESQGKSAIHVGDQRDCLLAIIANMDNPNPKSVETKIISLFQDDQPGVTFSTVHRAKGSESNNVYIIAPEKMPFPKGNRQEENNILFVALTRSKNNLHFVQGSL